MSIQLARRISYTSTPLDFCAFYLCTQSPEEGAMNRICFIPASCERLSIRNRIVPVPGQWRRFPVIPASCEWGLSVDTRLVGFSEWSLLLVKTTQTEARSF